MNADATVLAGAATTDDALRAYLDDLRHDDLARIGAAILGNGNPMERMVLIDERRRLIVRRRTLEAAFVAQAGAWSAAERIGRAAFLAECVPGEVLDRAGIRD